MPKLTDISPTKIEQPSDNERQPLQPQNNISREFWAKRLAAKQNELTLVETELDEERNLGNEDKLAKKAERLLQEIEEINAKLI